MDPLTIIVIVAGLILSGIVTFIDDAFEKMLNPIFRLVGLKSSTGPLDIIAKNNDRFIELTITNNGKGKAMLAAIQVLGKDGQKKYPLPCTSEIEAKGEFAEKKEKELRKYFSSEKINPRSQKIVYLSSAKLDGYDPHSLTVLDMDAKYWSVTIE